MKRIVPLLIGALLIGAMVVFFIPFGTGLVSKIQNPTWQKIFGNRFVQILEVGAIAMVGLWLVGKVAEVVET